MPKKTSLINKYQSSPRSKSWPCETVLYPWPKGRVLQSQPLPVTQHTKTSIKCLPRRLRAGCPPLRISLSKLKQIAKVSSQWSEGRASQLNRLERPHGIVLSKVSCQWTLSSSTPEEDSSRYFRYVDLPVNEYHPNVSWWGPLRRKWYHNE